MSLKKISGSGFESLLLGRSLCLGLRLQRPVRVTVPTRVTLCCTCAFICVVLWQAPNLFLSLVTVFFFSHSLGAASADSREREWRMICISVFQTLCACEQAPCSLFMWVFFRYSRIILHRSGCSSRAHLQSCACLRDTCVALQLFLTRVSW